MSSKAPYVQAVVALVLVILISYMSLEFLTLPSTSSAPYIQTNDAHWKGWANVDTIFSLYVCLPRRALLLDDKPYIPILLYT